MPVANIPTSRRREKGESSDVEGAHVGRDDMEQRQVEMRVYVVGLIYDSNEDGSLSDEEKAVLFEVFTARCEFDTDSAGPFSDELATCRTALRELSEPSVAQPEVSGVVETAFSPMPVPEPSSRGDGVPLQHAHTDERARPPEPTAQP